MELGVCLLAMWTLSYYAIKYWAGLILILLSVSIALQLFMIQRKIYRRPPWSYNLQVIQMTMSYDNVYIYALNLLSAIQMKE